jgi:GDPmannose 4,6-dehydratase
MKKALITGITGQDGSYLAELLLVKGYEVHGLTRQTSLEPGPIGHLCEEESYKERFFLHRGDLRDSSSLKHVIDFVQPDEMYNLASVSHMVESYDRPEHTADVAAMGTLRLLEAIRIHCPTARFYQATSSELFGNAKEMPQTEKTPFSPRSLYGIAKLYSFLAVVHFRETYQLFACNGILFNHESPRRGETFVSRKIVLAALRIHAGLQDKLILGNLDAKRDWGYAKDFVEGMWGMLQREVPEDYVLATGQATTVRKFVELAFLEVGMEISWEGQCLNEKGIDRLTGKVVVQVSPDFFRPVEDNVLVGDPSKAKEKLGWCPKTSLQELVQIMMKSDREQLGMSEINPSLGNTQKRILVDTLKIKGGIYEVN